MNELRPMIALYTTSWHRCVALFGKPFYILLYVITNVQKMNGRTDPNLQISKASLRNTVHVLPRVKAESLHAPFGFAGVSKNASRQFLNSFMHVSDANAHHFEAETDEQLVGKSFACETTQQNAVMANRYHRIFV